MCLSLPCPGKVLVCEGIGVLPCQRLVCEEGVTACRYPPAGMHHKDMILSLRIEKKKNKTNQDGTEKTYCYTYIKSVKAF